MAALSEMRLEQPALDGMLSLLTDRTSMVYLVGRVNPATWRHFEQEVACRTSGIIEGRGMKATGSSTARFLSSMLQQHGVDYVFRTLEACADGAIIDTRPLLAGPKGELPTEDEILALVSE